MKPLEDIRYDWQSDYPKVRALVQEIADAHDWDETAVDEMTNVVGPEEAVKMVKMAVAWRTGQIPDTNEEVLEKIYCEQMAVALELGMTGEEFANTWKEIYSKRLLNPANAYHMLMTRAYASPTYGMFLSSIPTAECMLFTRGIAKRLDGSFPPLGVNSLGGNIDPLDPSIVWCQMDTGCRFDRDRGTMLLQDIYEDVRSYDDSEMPYCIAVLGAGYLTEMLCTGWLDSLDALGKRIRIAACDADPHITYDLLYGHTSQNVSIVYHHREMLEFLRPLFEDEPNTIIAKGVMSYNLTPQNGSDHASETIACALEKLPSGGTIRFDLQLNHPVNLRNGLSFAWGFPVERTMEVPPGGIRLLTRDEVDIWLAQLKDHTGLPDGSIEVADIIDDLGPMTSVIRITKP